MTPGEQRREEGISTIRSNRGALRSCCKQENSQRILWTQKLKHRCYAFVRTKTLRRIPNGSKWVKDWEVSFHETYSFDRSLEFSFLFYNKKDLKSQSRVRMWKGSRKSYTNSLCRSDLEEPTFSSVFTYKSHLTFLKRSSFNGTTFSPRERMNPKLFPRTSNTKWRQMGCTKGKSSILRE